MNANAAPYLLDVSNVVLTSFSTDCPAESATFWPVLKHKRVSSKECCISRKLCFRSGLYQKNQTQPTFCFTWFFQSDIEFMWDDFLIWHWTLGAVIVFISHHIRIYVAVCVVACELRRKMKLSFLIPPANSNNKLQTCLNHSKTDLQSWHCQQRPCCVEVIPARV